MSVKVTIKKLRQKPEGESGAALYAEYPVFSPDEEPADSEKTADKKEKAKAKKRAASLEKLNRAVEGLVGAAAKSGKAGECVAVTHQIYQCNESIISFALDVLRTAGNSLVYINRFCFNWDPEAGVMLPLSAVTAAHRRLIKENGSADFTISGGSIYMHKNTFTPEAGKTCRRSRYKKFLLSTAYSLNGLSEPKKSKKLKNRRPARNSKWS